MDHGQDRPTPSAVSGTRQVLLVDGHRSYAEALSVAVDAQADLRCVAIALSASEACDAALRHRADVAIVDLDLRDEQGVPLAVRLRTERPDLPIVAATASADPATVTAAARSGVSALLRKGGSLRDLLRAVRHAGEGPLIIDAELLDAVATSRAPAQACSAPLTDVVAVHLTPREREVLMLLAAANDARAIARRLEVSLHTVRGHLKALLAKLDAHSQLEAVVRATRLGLLADDVPLDPSEGRGDLPLISAA